MGEFNFNLLWNKTFFQTSYFTTNAVKKVNHLYKEQTEKLHYLTEQTITGFAILSNYIYKAYLFRFLDLKL